MKRKLAILFTLAFSMFLLSTTAFASELRWNNVTIVYPSISVSRGEYACEIQGIKGTTKIDCTLILYEKASNGTLKELSRHSQVIYGRSYEFSKSYPLSNGKTYTLKVSAAVTSNGTVEEINESYEKAF